MFIQQEMKKEDKLSFRVTTEGQTRDGLLSILIKLKQFLLRELTKISDGT
jgi:sulfur transfer protein SufE